LCAARAAVLASLLPAEFPRDTFGRLLGFGKPGKELVAIRRLLDAKTPGTHLAVGFDCDRAFKAVIYGDDLDEAHASAKKLWGDEICLLDPMAGGGSIPLESARLGFSTLANEYNPVACSVLEVTVDYPFRFGGRLTNAARKWATEWEKRFSMRMERFFHEPKGIAVRDYIFARTVPCPDTGFHTPLVPDWHLLKPKGSDARVWVEPVVDKKKGTWTVKIVDAGAARGKRSSPPAATCKGGKGISLFSHQQISGDYIKAKAQAGEMRSALYAIAVKTSRGLEFILPKPEDLKALAAAAKELARLRPQWEKDNVIPTEHIGAGLQPGSRLDYGAIKRWDHLFSPRQLLGMGTIVEELRRLRPEILKKEAHDLGECVVHLLALTIDKLLNHNCIVSRFENTRQVIKGIWGRHGYEFHFTFAEMAPCASGAGLAWAIDNVLEAYTDISKLVGGEGLRPVSVTNGTATNLPQLADGSVTAVVVDPPYADNVQYSELADFFYVWLKRTQGHRRPEWFSTYLCDHSEEAVVNAARFRGKTDGAKTAREQANAHYARLMTETFREARRVLRDDGVLTVMFTHKKQEAWEALFASLIGAGFTITATWPVKTESEHSLHQAKKNAAQSTVILVARKRSEGAGTGWFGDEMKADIRFAARKSAERLQKEGLNPVDQLVGSFGPAMEVYSRYDAVKTDTGEAVGVDRAIDLASEAMTAFRIEQLAERGLEGVEAEGRFALLCWDVLQAAEFRFNEANLLGKAVGMDVATLELAGLLVKAGDKVRLLSAQERRRAKKREPKEMEETLLGLMPSGKKKRTRKADALKVHPNDPGFRTALDGCHALAVRWIEEGSDNPGLEAARQLAAQQAWKGGGAVARLMEALVRAAPPALWFERGKTSTAAQYPEFRAWHALLTPLFGIAPPEWKETIQEQSDLFSEGPSDDEEEEAENDEEEGEE